MKALEYGVPPKGNPARAPADVSPSLRLTSPARLFNRVTLRSKRHYRLASRYACRLRSATQGERKVQGDIRCMDAITSSTRRKSRETHQDSANPSSVILAILRAFDPSNSHPLLTSLAAFSTLRTLPSTSTSHYTATTHRLPSTNEPTVDQCRSRPPPTRITLICEYPIEMVDNRWTLPPGRTAHILRSSQLMLLEVPFSPFPVDLLLIAPLRSSASQSMGRKDYPDAAWTGGTAESP